jgi:two-component system response regulator NreC
VSKLRIVLADDHEVMREGLRLLVNSQPDMECVGEAGDGREAVALACQLRPDVVLMDVSMPSMSGLEATRQIKKSCPEVKVIALTRHADDSYIQQLLQAGANGYVLKLSAADELVRAVRAAVEGKTYLDPEVARHVAEVAGRPSAGRDYTVKALSAREEEVLRRAAMGYANKEIAERLRISVRTVEVHKANAMQKLCLKSRIDIVRYAILKGWLQDV